MRNLVLFGVAVASLVLLPYAIGVAQDGEDILLREDFEGKEKKDTWEVLERDAGSDYGVTKGFLNAFGSLQWQFRMPFTNQLPPGRLTGAVQLEFRYRISRSKDDQSFLVGLGWKDGVLVERAATVALNAGNLGINDDLEGTAAKQGDWHSVRLALGRLSNNTYEVHLNGSRVGFNIPVQKKGIHVDSVLMCTKPNARGSTGEWQLDDILVSIVPLSVEPVDKLATTWARLKLSR